MLNSKQTFPNFPVRTSAVWVWTSVVLEHCEHESERETKIMTVTRNQSQTVCNSCPSSVLAERSKKVISNLNRSLRLTLSYEFRTFRRWSHSLNANLFNRLGVGCCGIWSLFPDPCDRANEGTILYIYIFVLLQNLIRKGQREGLRDEKKNICSEKWKLIRLSSKYIKGYAVFLSFLWGHQMRTNRQTDAKSDKKRATLPYPCTSGAPFHTQRRQAAIEKGVSWSPLTAFDLFAFTFSFLLN